ncbi:nucleotidyltransferase family protein [Paracidovorax avenae]|uniref:nucleotidyltransferase family protein n=1 Tax=Paracidovorax avenae TaxID=80867 RepID=UPI000D2120D3|nr:nucleotidyltransferase family protein [Paracidovorax avenae]AVS93620.1 nucleotidyltransferase family protein [Paracidovorax avenae]AVT00147.1 nucleotidyltransferase family protein [Paracidovorax avenae]AVT07103.1 nucleotidyltransferase family protein [Paracidovorax avenae]
MGTSPPPESPGATAVAGIILAAGASSRFGSDKRRALLADGTPMLAAVAGSFARVFARTAVVLPPGDAFGLELCTRLGLDAVPNERCREGQGASLAAAMQWSLAQPGLQAVVVGLADMPWVHEDTLAALRDALVQFPGEPAMPLWRGQPGNPRGIPQRCFASLAQASGAQAAAHRIDWGAAHTVAVDDPGIVRDVDTPADLVADADRMSASQAADAAARHA